MIQSIMSAYPCRNQDLLLLDAEPTNGILRKTLSEFVRNKIKSYEKWKNKRTKRLWSA